VNFSKAYIFSENIPVYLRISSLSICFIKTAKSKRNDVL